ncbi:MAG: hypothetical protein Q8T11_06410 [Elusimicrobiota bacterium]|nr:hypothetical protein [Elusimicrobiota bacterium]
MISSALVLLLAAAGSAFAGTATSSAAVTASAAVGVTTQTVSTIYTGDRVRDPFLPAAMGGGSARRRDDAKTEGPEVVDIHAMSLRGIMKDDKIDYALFTSETGSSYLLRGGRLYDERQKPVPGIRGAIKIKQKTVELITPDKDVQVFRLGEDEKDKETP